jgi:lactate dehydrogenase-like 2-hydroxyacid dehydrogenase
VSIAILDDYLDIGRPKFARLVDRVEIVTFPDTLQTIDPEQREALIERLYPFTIISTMRERTVLSADVLKCLPNLKLILTTGPKNAAIDIQTCKELGIAVVGASGAGRSDWLSSEDKPPTSLDSTMQHT